MTEVVDGPTSNDTVLRITRLVAGYGLRPVLSQVSLDISAGQWLALLGPNGSGKSTLLYCIAGMLKPTSGEVEICGSSLSLDAITAKRALGFGCAPDVLPPLLTGRQCLEVHAAAKGVRQVDPEVLDLLANFKFTPFLDQFVDTYSLGTRQKLAVLLALIGAPRLIVLDEAFNGLDPAAAQCLKRHLRDLVETRRASVLLATHALDVVERYADRAVLMLAGRIVRVWEPAAMAEFRNSGTLEDAIAAAADEAQPEPL